MGLACCDWFGLWIQPEMARANNHKQSSPEQNQFLGENSSFQRGKTLDDYSRFYLVSQRIGCNGSSVAMSYRAFRAVHILTPVCWGRPYHWPRNWDQISPSHYLCLTVSLAEAWWDSHWEISVRKLGEMVSLIDLIILFYMYNGRFKPGTFFVSSIILRAKHELTSKVASRSVLLRLLQVRPVIIAKEL